jgi:hypothetical protein
MEQIIYHYRFSSIIENWGDQNEYGKTNSIFKIQTKESCWAKILTSKNILFGCFQNNQILPSNAAHIFLKFSLHLAQHVSTPELHHQGLHI